MFSLTEWRIELIPPDEEGSRFYLDYYKPFRLAALEQDPDGKVHRQMILAYVLVPPEVDTT